MKRIVIISFLAILSLTSLAQNRRPAKSIGLTIDDYCVAIRSEYQLHKAEWEEIDRLRAELRQYYQTHIAKLAKSTSSPFPPSGIDNLTYQALKYRCLAYDMAFSAPKGTPRVSSILTFLRIEAGMQRARNR